MHTTRWWGDNWCRSVCTICFCLPKIHGFLPDQKKKKNTEKTESNIADNINQSHHRPMKCTDKCKCSKILRWLLYVQLTFWKKNKRTKRKMCYEFWHLKNKWNRQSKSENNFVTHRQNKKKIKKIAYLCKHRIAWQKPNWY